MEIPSRVPPTSPALEELVPQVYDELRAVAEHYFRRQPAGFTLRPTELVNEACLHLIDHARIDWTSTGHFRAIAARKIWQVIIDHLRRRNAQKRGGLKCDSQSIERVDSTPASQIAHRPGPLDRVTVEWRDRDVDLLDLADAMAELGNESRRLHDAVMLHWFAGMTHAEVAEHLGVSTSTAEKDFRYALAWLKRRLKSDTVHGN